MIENRGISVIIPNYNGSKLLPEILPFLYEALQNIKLPYEIIISDDCSTDESVALIKRNYPSIHLLENSINSGFSITINKGIYTAKYDFLLLLNSDVKLTSNYFENLLPYFDEPDTFGVMGRIIGWDDDETQDGGKYPSFHGVKIKTSGNYVPLEPKQHDRLFSMYLSGANAFVSRHKIIELGGFDEIFSPFYVEDFELSLRAWRLGMKCYYEHFAICRHQTSSTIKSKSGKAYIKKIYYRNKLFVHAIHLEGAKLFLWYLQLLPESFMHLALGRFWTFQSFAWFLKSKQSINDSRKKFQLLAKKQNSTLSVAAVVHKILLSLNNTPIKQFK